MNLDPSGKWSDLTARVGSAVVMIAVGVICIWRGELYFRGLVAIVAGLMMWELIRMRAPHRRKIAVAVAVACAAAVMLFSYVGFWAALGLVLAPAVLAGLASYPNWKIGVVYALVIVIGSDTLVAIRDQLGFGWLVWIVAVVIISDVAGYFAGKALGGPKFWPRVSPKKTWSGTVAGWVGAGLIGVVFGLGTGVMLQIVLMSVLLSFAGQLGDIAESAVKRRSGVKDSSSLIPGHGGVLDRFDALLGASLALLLAAWGLGFPQGLL